MKFSTALIALAATTAPLYAQQAPAAPLTNTIAAVQQAPAAAKATPAQRAAAFPTLALLPANVDVFLASAQNDTIISWFKQLGATTDYPLSMSVGMTADSAALMNMLSTILSCTMQNAMQAQLGQPTPASPDLKPLLEAAASKQLTPVYVVISGNEKEMAELYQSVLEGFQVGIEEMGDCARPEKMQGMEGMTLDLEKLAAQAPEEAREDFGDVLNLAKGRKVSVFCKLVGDKLVFAASENPEAIRIPASAEESVLATDKCAALDQSLSTTPLCYAYATPEVMKGLAAANAASIRTPMQALKASMLLSGVSPEALKPVHESMDKMTNLLLRMNEGVRNMKHPSSLLVWMSPGDLHLEVSGDACGLTMAKEPLKLTTLAADPSVALYYEQNKFILPDYYPSASEVFETVEGFTLAVLGAQGEQESLALYQMVRPDLDTLGKGLSTMGDGLSGNVSFTLRENPDAILAGSVYCGVSNRATLASGWQQVLKAAADCGARFGINPDFVNTLPIAQAPGPKGSTRYSIVSPIPLPAGLTPNVLVSDQALVIGSNAELNDHLVNSVSATAAFPGYVFSFNPDAAARIARRMADQLNAAPALSPEANMEVEASVDVEADAPEVEGPSADMSGDEEDVEYVDEGEDYEEVYTCDDDACGSSDCATNVADALEAFASKVGLITGATTVKDDGTYKVRVDVKIKG